MLTDPISRLPLHANGAIALTGAASGIGAATAARLNAAGHRVITVDLHDADVVCDLATEAGRRLAIEKVTELAGDALAGLVTCAGVDTSRNLPGSRVVSINYFGTVALLDGLRPALARRGDAAVVCVGSSSATVIPDLPVELLQLCLAGDESRAGELADATGPALAYGASKAAVALYVRHSAVKPEWIGAGIRMNAVAPGFIETPLLGKPRDASQSDPVLETFLEATPAAASGSRTRSPRSSPSCSARRPGSSAARWCSPTAGWTPSSAPTTGSPSGTGPRDWSTARWGACGGERPSRARTKRRIEP